MRANWLYLLLLTCCLPVQAERLRVAVAGNFIQPMRLLAAHYEARTGQTVALSFGSSGKFYAQIQQGAPFDVFLSADRDKPEQLVAQKLALADSLVDYARGALVLWVPQVEAKHASGAEDTLAILTQGHYSHAATAHRKLAPYGQAALEVLNKLELAIDQRWVQGESVAQAYRFVASGRAQLGLLARSQFNAEALNSGAVYPIPNTWHKPIVQSSVVLAGSKQTEAAYALLAFLTSAEAQTIIADFGYLAPIDASGLNHE